jgi:hypothetical protein
MNSMPLALMRSRVRERGHGKRWKEVERGRVRFKVKR